MVTVASRSKPGVTYEVTSSGCTCPGYQYRRRCSHITTLRERMVDEETQELALTSAPNAMMRSLAPTQPQSLEETLQVAKVLVKSGFFQDTQEVAQAVAKILYGQELGVPPVQSLMGVHIVQGKPAPSAGLIASLIQRSRVYTYRVRQLEQDICSLEFFRRSRDRWESLGLSTFTADDAKVAGAYEGKNAHTWRKFPRNMLFARAMSNGARWYCAEIFGGPVYTPEELDATVDEEGNVLPGAVVRPPAWQPDWPEKPPAGGAGESAAAREVFDEDEPIAADDPLWRIYAEAGLRAREAGVEVDPLPSPFPRGAVKGEIARIDAAIRQAHQVRRRLPAAPPQHATFVPATPAQIKAIYVIGRNEQQLSEDDVEDMSRRNFGRQVSELSKREASEFIDLLKAPVGR